MGLVTLLLHDLIPDSLANKGNSYTLRLIFCLLMKGTLG